MSLSTLDASIDSSKYELISTDLFDTVLLRDSTTETERLAMVCRRAAVQLGVDPSLLTRLRWDGHDSAYRAVAIERPQGDVSLAGICRTVVTALGLDERAAQVLHDVEVAVDIEHLRANRPLLQILDRGTRSDKRLIAISDTYYSSVDLRHLLDVVVGPHPLAEIYSSADLNVTKHGGRIFEEIGRLERVSANQILHVGDNWHSDVQMARAASWTAVYLPRNGRYRAAKLAGKVMALPVRMRRFR